jgi:hypothetical protein
MDAIELTHNYGYLLDGIIIIKVEAMPDNILI